MFSPDTYYRLFELYNAAIWPAQIIALAAGVVILALLVRRPPWAGRAVAALLAAAWVFVAWAYFWERYATINLAAPYYAWGFAAQAVLLMVVGAILGRLTFGERGTDLGKAGCGLFAVALILSPLLGLLAGRGWAQLEAFGVAPDPTVIGTFGVLAAADRMRWELLVIPALWALITGATLWTMRSPDALVTPAAALFAVAVAVLRIFRSREDR